MDAAADYSQGRRGSARTALILSVAIGAHLLLLFLTTSRSERIVASGGHNSAFILVQVLPERAIPPSPVTHLRAQRAPVRAPRIEPNAAFPITVEMPAPEPKSPSDARDTIAPDIAADTLAPDAIPRDVIGRAKRDVGKIDRMLRGSRPPVPAQKPDSPFARFEAALAGAFIDRSSGVVMDRYTAPDGVVITRVTQGNKVRCYTSGTVNFSPGMLKDSARPSSANCPSANSGWTGL